MQNHLGQTILIVSKEKNSWQSCHAILDNLISFYQSYFPTLIILNVEDDSEQRLKEMSPPPTTIIIADQRINFPSLSERVPFLKGLKIKWIWHLYGDFIHRIASIIPMNTFFLGEDLRLVCGSRPFERVVARMLTNTKSVHCFPFPFLFKPTQILERPTTHFTYLYAGRICFPKNVIALIKLFKKYRKADDRLIICGKIDTSHEVFSEDCIIQNYTAETFYELIQNDHQIDYLGSLSKEEMACVYQRADCLINLSTFEFEDYGLAPREALSYGLKLILSAWGGFQDLSNLLGVYMVPLEFKDNDFYLDEDQFERHFKNVRRDDPERSRIIEEFSATCSPEMSQKYFDSILNKSPELFQGWNAETIKYVKRNIAFSKTKEHLKRHLTIYEPYYRPVH